MKDKNLQITIQINGWEKYNPKKNMHNASWVRLERNIWTDQKFIVLTCPGKLLYILLLTLGVPTDGVVQTSSKHLAYLMQSKGVPMETLLKKLHELQLIMISDFEKMLSTNVRTNERTHEISKPTVKSQKDDDENKFFRKEVSDLFLSLTEKKYYAKVIIDAAYNSNIKRFVKKATKEKAKALVEHYFSMKEYDFCKHSVGMLYSAIHAIDISYQNKNRPQISVKQIMENYNGVKNV